MEFFERVKELVKKNGITIETVAGEAGLSRNSYNSYRIKGNLPRADEAVKIAKKLGVTVEELVDGTRPKEWRPPENILAIVDDLLRLPRDKQDFAAVIIHAILEHTYIPEANQPIMPELDIRDAGEEKKAGA